MSVSRDVMNPTDWGAILTATCRRCGSELRLRTWGDCRYVLPSGRFCGGGRNGPLADHPGHSQWIAGYDHVCDEADALCTCGCPPHKGRCLSCSDISPEAIINGPPGYEARWLNSNHKYTPVTIERDHIAEEK